MKGGHAVVTLWSSGARIRRNMGNLGMRHIIDEFRERFSSAIVHILACHLVGVNGRFNIEWKASSHGRFQDELKASFWR